MGSLNKYSARSDCNSHPVECHTGDIQKLALGGTDYKSWVVGRAFLDAVKYRNYERNLEAKSSGTLRKTVAENSDDLYGHGTS
jgi:hypothetical protein